MQNKTVKEKNGTEALHQAMQRALPFHCLLPSVLHHQTELKSTVVMKTKNLEETLTA